MKGAEKLMPPMGSPCSLRSEVEGMFSWGSVSPAKSLGPPKAGLVAGAGGVGGGVVAGLGVGEGHDLEDAEAFLAGDGGGRIADHHGLTVDDNMLWI